MKDILLELGIQETNSGTWIGKKALPGDGQTVTSYSPATGKEIAKVSFTTDAEYEQVVEKASESFLEWRMIPAPKRGDIVRQIGDALRKYKDPLGKLVSLEMGKIYQEGLGEVQEMIDICDFAVGLSRQLYGFTMHSERPQHRMYDQYHPLGICGVISAFNFPVAVWSWNTMLAAICGDVVIWKPSEKTPLTAIACQKIVNEVLAENDVPEGVFNLVMGDRNLGEKMAQDSRIPLISATGSTRMGKAVSQTVAARLGKTILELGGNNAIIVSEKADLEMVIRATVFGAAGTAGQRCTSTRRVLIQESVFDDVKDRLLAIYKQLPLGDPLDEKTLVGPLIDGDAVDMMQSALKKLKEEGGEILFGGEVVKMDGELAGGHFVRPAVCKAENSYEVVQTETFAPILYLIPFKTLDDAIAMHNGVVQGLSSAIFTMDMREAETFLSHMGSDCGIANVNIGTSGAEIGGAFGGEKETGGGRESGSDAWKAYMRRQTNTINWGSELPLAQGINFDV